METKQNSQASLIKQIRRLAQKRGTPVDIQRGKKKRFITFKYSTRSGYVVRSYSSVESGILGELKKLG